MRPYLEHWTWLWHRKDIDLLDQVQRRTIRIIREKEHFCGKAERIGIVHPGKEKALRRPYNSLSVPNEACRIAGEGLLTNACSDRIRGNGFKLKEDRR